MAFASFLIFVLEIKLNAIILSASKLSEAVERAQAM
jgi:hypothetical protein